MQLESGLYRLLHCKLDTITSPVVANRQTPPPPFPITKIQSTLWLGECGRHLIEYINQISWAGCRVHNHKSCRYGGHGDSTVILIVYRTTDRPRSINTDKSTSIIIFEYIRKYKSLRYFVSSLGLILFSNLGMPLCLFRATNWEELVKC